ncbi:MAG: polyprenyl synthetase family protein [Clostridia bacterium]|nr:polyprenyl synthetase family protein [Clostridia bacterium]
MSNKFVEYLKEYKSKCDSFVEGKGAREFLSSFGLDNEMGTYIDALLHHTLGGKRIRACLVSLGYGLFAGFERNEDVLLPSLSYEFFQTGILAHDDIIDNSDYRRFKPSMHKYLGQGHDGVSKSICVGDFGIVSAIEILQRCDFSDSVKLKAVSHQNKVFSATIAGELKDIEFSYADKVSESEILEMYRLKTAQYTVSGPLVLGAILAGADEKSIKLLSDFGDAVGISFQIRDDILGLYGDEAKVGKSITSDMCEGKKTVLVSHFDTTASDEQRNEFYSIYGRKESGICELERVREILISTCSLEYAENLCKSYVDAATRTLAQININEGGISLLFGLLEYMTSRNS